MFNYFDLKGVFPNMNSSNDPYLIERIVITKNMSDKHLLEVNGLCPLCGKYLIETKGNRTSKKYEIAHIYPNSPTTKEIIILNGLERLGNNCEDFENKIALCKDCHHRYDDNKTKEEYLKLLNIKKEHSNISNAKVAASTQDLEKEIFLVISNFSNISYEIVNNLRLEIKALKIDKKIEDKYRVLKIKITEYVCLYFKYIRETFRTLDSSRQINFKLIASEIHTAFLKCEKEIEDKSQIFNSLVNWLHSKNKDTSIEACEVLISFFIQNCEVFNEISE